MREFTESFGFIVFFVVISLGVDMAFGDRVLFLFLLLVLSGMVLVNWSKIGTLIGRYSKP